MAEDGAPGALFRLYIRLYRESGFLLEICGENRDGRTITGDLRMTKRGRSLTIREIRLGGDGNPITGQWIFASHSWGVGRSLSGPAFMPGRRSGRARLAPPL